MQLVEPLERSLQNSMGTWLITARRTTYRADAAEAVLQDHETYKLGSKENCTAAC